MAILFGRYSAIPINSIVSYSIFGDRFVYYCEMVLGFCEVVVALAMLVLLLLDIYCVIKLGSFFHFELQTKHVQWYLYGNSSCLSLCVLLWTQYVLYLTLKHSPLYSLLASERT